MQKTSKSTKEMKLIIGVIAVNAFLMIIMPSLLTFLLGGMSMTAAFSLQALESKGKLNRPVIFYGLSKAVPYFFAIVGLSIFSLKSLFVIGVIVAGIYFFNKYKLKKA